MVAKTTIILTVLILQASDCFLSEILLLCYFSDIYETYLILKFKCGFGQWLCFWNEEVTIIDMYFIWLSHSVPELNII